MGTTYKLAIYLPNLQTRKLGLQNVGVMQMTIWRQIVAPSRRQFVQAWGSDDLGNAGFLKKD
jgi:hypothetical protein